MDEIKIYTTPGWPSECGACGAMIAQGMDRVHRAWHKNMPTAVKTAIEIEEESHEDPPLGYRS